MEIAQVKNAQAPRNKPHEVEEATGTLSITRKCFRHLALDYVLQVRTLFSKDRLNMLLSLCVLLKQNLPDGNTHSTADWSCVVQIHFLFGAVCILFMSKNRLFGFSVNFPLYVIHSLSAVCYLQWNTRGVPACCSRPSVSLHRASWSALLYGSVLFCL